MRIILILLLLITYLPAISYSSGYADHNDQYIKGYVHSICVNGYNLPREAVTVHHGVIIIDEEQLNGKIPDQVLEKVQQATASIKEVKGVRLKGQQLDRDTLVKQKTMGFASDKEKFKDVALPYNSLFQPLIADPKWPRFTLAYQYYDKKNNLLRHGFAPNFGASFPLYRVINQVTNSEWEIGIQAGLFALMDIGSKPTALINADYYIAVPVTYHKDEISTLVKIYHQSSHLGDEFMLTPEGQKTKRINLSYEGIDALLSYNFNSFRLYGGGGYIVHKDPGYIKPLKAQIGAEYYSPNTFFNGRLRPIMGIDITAQEMSSWYPGISCKAGVQLENSALFSNKVQFMPEYYSGKSVNGQFYNDKVQYIGFGVQAFL